MRAAVLAALALAADCAEIPSDTTNGWRVACSDLPAPCEAQLCAAYGPGAATPAMTYVYVDGLAYQCAVGLDCDRAADFACGAIPAPTPTPGY